MSNENLLCDEHWEKCLARMQGKSVEVCETCPTRPENQDAWERLLVSNQLNSDGMRTLLISQQQEIKSLRRHLRGDGNGTAGILWRLVRIEARWSVIKWALGVAIAVGGLVLSLFAVVYR